jgi:hypothetical protein
MGAAPAAVFALILSIIFHVDARRRARLLRGEDILARWTIPPALVPQFEALRRRCNQSAAGHTPLPDYLFPRPNARGEIEVLIGAAAVMAGGDFHALPVRGYALIHGPEFIALTPGGGINGGGLLEFRITTHASADSTTRRWALRIPIPPGHEEDIRRIHSHYQQRADDKLPA